MSGVVSSAMICLGSVFLLVGALGAAAPRAAMVRLHYVSLSSMVGAPLALVGAAVHDPADAVKLVLIAVLLVASSPVAGAATARALHRGAQREQRG